ncbi:MAG TPA: DUF1440 domain-containing protein [Bryobacteraceae bacterium]|nr:DUF1440 domain-containing protein [Bryobacteraceae bacterium]
MEASKTVRKQSILRGAAAGAAGGVLGTLAMNAVSLAWTIGRRGAVPSNEASLVEQGGRPDVESAKKEGRSSYERGAVATTKIAEKIAEPALGRTLSPQERHKAGKFVHYSYGVLLGAAYGAARERVPAISSGIGLPFGLITWAVAVELVLPKLGLMDSPRRYTAGEHGFSAVSHAAYGLVAEVTRRTLRAAVLP